MRAEPYDVGDTAEVTLSFTVNGIATDPTTCSLAVKPPTGASYTVTPTKTSTGVYALAVDLTEPGTWSFFATGTGPAKCAQPYDLFVRAKPF